MRRAIRRARRMISDGTRKIEAKPSAFLVAVLVWMLRGRMAGDRPRPPCPGSIGSEFDE